MFIILAVITAALVIDRIRIALQYSELERDLDRIDGETIALWSCLKARDKEINRLRNLNRDAS